MPVWSSGSFRVKREPIRKLLHLSPDLRLYRRGPQVGQHLIDETRDLGHLAFAHTARRDGRRADADTTRDHRALRLERHRVLVDGDPRPVERLLRVLSGDVASREAEKHEMSVRAPGHEPVAVPEERR